MKKALFLLLSALALTACGSTSKNDQTVTNPEQAQTVPNGVEVLCFHGKQRCATCIAIERNAKLVTDSLLTLKKYQGKLKFSIIDITQKENEALADQYEVTWSSLILVGNQNGQETVDNLTEYAFRNARKSPDAFRTELTERINHLLQ